VSVWQSLRGQERVVAQLQRAIERDRVPHAYLFSGPSGAPMYETAIALAMALSCHRARGVGCDAGDRCEACSKIAGGFHPDVVTLAREGAAQIVPIESVRNQVIARMGLPPHEGEVRVFIVEEATSMAPPAANALLKTLEEPPARTLFVLCTTAPEQLLPTIRSRCQRVRFGGGAAVAADADPARAERVAALGAELAGDKHDPSLPSRIAEAKGDAAPVLVAAAQALHTKVHDAAAAGDLGAARRASARAQAILSWHIAVSIHNANPVLAMDALIAQLGQLPAFDAVP
jgi:DNA polymerase III delta' subunit